MPQLFGISLEVYLVIFIIALLVFFLFRWILKSFFKVKRSSLYSLIITVITAPILYVVLILVWLTISSYYPDRDFDRAVWLQNKEIRYEYTSKLNEDRLLEGMTREQVVEYLGEPSFYENSSIVYYMGYKPAILGIDPDWLKIKFKDGYFSEMSEYNL